MNLFRSKEVSSFEISWGIQSNQRGTRPVWFELTLFRILAIQMVEIQKDPLVRKREDRFGKKLQKATDFSLPTVVCCRSKLEHFPTDDRTVNNLNQITYILNTNENLSLNSRSLNYQNKPSNLS